ncbi:MAG: nucleotide sugar dehydrogenase [Candidatus Kerfeldbacteria bacterium]|jgi:UDP-N-acetyl-D-glucosamine dehydrogenase
MKKTVKKRKTTKSKKYKGIVTVIGLGYVGLPLACLCVEKGYKTFGVAIDRKKINMINRGENPLTDEPELNQIIAKKLISADTSFENVSKSDVIVICVPTPVDKLHHPDLTPVKSASKSVSKYLKKGQLVVIESTINPGVCQEIVQPIIDKESGMEAGKDYFLAHSPERVNPGDPVWKVRNIPRVVGAISKKGLKVALKFYGNILDGSVRGMKSIKEAEATKVIENSFRDINIAFVNELAKSFDKLGIDLYDTLEGASTKPFAYLPHWPSIGVGGHCIPVDPYYLIERAKLAGFDHKFLKMSREINNSMPKYAVGLLSKMLNKISRPMMNTSVGVLGLSYKANVGDIRESPSLEVIKLLQEHGSKVEIFDPYFQDKSTVNSLEDLLKKVDVIVVATNHKEFVNISSTLLKKYKIKMVLDGKNCLDKAKIQKAKIIYKGIGR